MGQDGGSEPAGQSTRRATHSDGRGLRGSPLSTTHSSQASATGRVPVRMQARAPEGLLGVMHLGTEGTPFKPFNSVPCHFLQPWRSRVLMWRRRCGDKHV